MKLFTALASIRQLYGTPYAQLNASNYSANTKFGTSVAISATGTVVAVSAPDAKVGTVTAAGIVYIYNASLVTEEAVLADVAPVIDERFGFSVALSADGNTLAIGAPGATVNGSTLAGCVYIYRKTGTEWIKQAKIVSLNPQYNAGFGHSVALSADGNRVAIGAPRHQVDAKVSGYVAVYGYSLVYNQTYYDWNNVAEYTTITFGYSIIENGGFGWQVALNADGTKLAISLPFVTVGTTAPNAGLVFFTDMTTQLKTTYSSDVPIADGFFGLSLAIDANGITLFIGEPGSSNPQGVIKTGAVHVTTIHQSERHKLWVAVPQANAQFGYAITTAGDTFVASAILEDTSVADTGSVYVFTKTAGVWVQRLDFDGVQSNGYFGSAVALSATGNVLAIGAKNEVYNGVASGNVYLII